MAEPDRRENPFAVLGLPATASLSDEDVRAAWRRIAAATHPDREDGGDPAVFGTAAAAYMTLRTSFGRGEALAELSGVPPTVAAPEPGRAGRHRRARGRVTGGRVTGGRVTGGRVTGGRVTGGRVTLGLVTRRRFALGRVSGGRTAPTLRAGLARGVQGLAARLAAGWRNRGLALRVSVAAAVGAAAFLAAGWSPGTAGVLTGALTWLFIAGRRL